MGGCIAEPHIVVDRAEEIESGEGSYNSNKC